MPAPRTITRGAATRFKRTTSRVKTIGRRKAGGQVTILPIDEKRPKPKKPAKKLSPEQKQRIRKKVKQSIRQFKKLGKKIVRATVNPFSIANAKLGKGRSPAKFEKVVKAVKKSAKKAGKKIVRG